MSHPTHNSHPTDQKALTYLLWLDLETSGLVPETDTILEIACVLTTVQLVQVRDVSFNHPIKPEGSFNMHPEAVDLHARSGLLAELKDGFPISLAESAILKLISDAVPSNARIILAGFSPQLDRLFIRLHMRTLDKRLHYRLFDVSTLRSAVHFWIQEFEPSTPAHRAWDDMLAALEWATKFSVIFQHIDVSTMFSRMAMNESKKLDLPS